MLGFAWKAYAGDVMFVAGTVAGLATIGRYLVVPVYRFFKRLETTITFCEGQLRPNGGSSLRDAIDKLVHRTDILEAIVRPPKEKP
jgi:hypothetical protein